LKKGINKIKTNLLEPGEAKDPHDSTVFQLWCAFADEAEREFMRQAFLDGIGWGEAKTQLFERVNDELAPARERYRQLINDPQQLEAILQAGAERLRPHSATLLARVRDAVGLRPYA